MAVVFADLVESVRLMQLHEESTLDRWRRYVALTREQVLPRLGGRMVRTAGDGLLIESPDAPSALDLAFALHEALEPFNEGVAPEDAMQLRVGIHVAEVLVEEHDLQGSGVNLASRLASLAQPGATVLSAGARDRIVDSFHAHLRDLGLRYVKGLPDPVRVFSAEPLGVATGAVRVPPPSGDELSPALVVVPFEGGMGNTEHEALGHVMADDIIATLSRHPGLRVLSRNSASALRGHSVERAWAQQALGASFLVSGRYHVRGARVRVSVELSDLRDGQVLWADTMMTEIEALFEGSDALVPEVVANVGRSVLAHELRRVRSLPMDSLAPYTLFLGAEGLMHSLVPRDFERAHEVLEGLSDRHPRQAAPYAMLARWHVLKTVQGWSTDRQADGRRAQDLAERAIDLDNRQSVALATAGLVRMNFHNDIDGARERYLAALEANPGEAHAWASLAAVHSHSGEHDAACSAAQRALAISPLDPNRFLFEAFAAMAHLGAGHYDEAVAHGLASVRQHALHAPTHRLLVAALGLAGRGNDARAAAHRYLQVQPSARVGERWRDLRGDQPVWENLFGLALREAGVPA